MSRRTLTRWSALVLATAAAALWAAPVFADDQTVTIQGFAFDPGTVTVQVGDTVTWTNKDGASHTATADDGSFDTDGIGSGTTASVTFDTAGTFAYHCKIHTDMTATVVVEAAAASPSPAPSSGGSGGGSGGSTTPPPTDTTRDSTSASTLETMIVTVLALGLIAAATLALVSLRLRPAEEAEPDR